MGNDNLLFKELIIRMSKKYNMGSIIILVSPRWSIARNIYLKNGFKEIKIMHLFFNIKPDLILSL